MQIIDGKKVSAQVKEKVRLETLELIEKHGITPGLAVVSRRSTLCPPQQLRRNCSRWSISSTKKRTSTEYWFSFLCQSTLTIRR